MSDRTDLQKWTLCLTSVAFFMVTLDALVVATSLPAIQRDLHASVATLEWTVNAYALPYAAGIVSAAALGDRLGRRAVFTAGLVLFTLASAVCAVAPSVTVLLGARVVQGIGAAAVMPLSLTILTNEFPPARRGAIVGIWGAIGGLAIAGGPLIGGALTQGIAWHWIFWVNVPIGIAAALLSRARLRESFGPKGRLDAAGVTLLSAGALALVWGLVRSGAAGWTSIEVAGTLGTGAALIAAFIAWEARTEAPMLPLTLFANRSFAAANATAFLMTGTIMAAAFLVAQYFQFVLGATPLATGLRLLPWTSTPIVVAPLAGALSDRFGPRPLMASGMLLQALGLGVFAALAGANPDYAELVAPLVVAGVGISMALPTTAAAALAAVPPPQIGKASGTNTTLQRFGGAFGVGVATAVFAAHGHIGTAAGFEAGFRPALAVAAGLSMLGACAALCVSAHPRSTLDPVVDDAVSTSVLALSEAR